MNGSSPVKPLYLAIGLGAAIVLAGTPLFPAVVALLLAAIVYDLVAGTPDKSAIG
jgi:hypothetical protein